jgi:hypothetical protein
MLVYFIAIWYLLWSFGTFCVLNQEKSGNPEWDAVAEMWKMPFPGKPMAAQQ